MVAGLKPTLTVSGLRKSYGSHRVIGGDLALEAGDFCLVLGENGAGKSTLLRCLLSLENYEGHIRIGELAPNGGILGVLDQPMMYPRWTVARNIAYLTNRSRALDSSVIQRLVQPQLFRQRVGRLSTGQKKIVLLAAVLSTDATVIVLDEFASGLDQSARETLRTELSMQVSCGRIVIATGHDLGAFRGLPSRVVLADEGRLRDVTDEYRAGHSIEVIYAKYLAGTRP